MLAGLAALLLIASSDSRRGSVLLGAARLVAVAATGLLLGSMGVLLTHVIGELRAHETTDRLITSTGPGAWFLIAAVAVTLIAAVCATTGGGQRDPAGAARVPSAGSRVLGAALLIVAAALAAVASPLSIFAVEYPAFRYSLTGWSQAGADSDSAGYVPQFGFSYLAAAGALAVGAALVVTASRRQRGTALLSAARGLSVLAVGGFVAVFWAMAVYVAWALTFDDPQFGYDVTPGAGFWVLLVAAIVTVPGVLLVLGGNGGGITIRFVAAPAQQAPAPPPPDWSPPPQVWTPPQTRSDWGP